MAGDEGLVTRVGGALDVRFGAWRHGPLASALDFSARAWVDLLLRVFLARVSNPRIDCAAGNSPGVGRGEPAVAGEPVAADLGMLPNLFRIGHRKNHGRRSAVAAFHGARRVLPERAAAHVDRVAHAASAALVPCDDGLRDAGAGTGAGVDDVSAAALSDPVLFDRDAVADRNHPLRKLHVSELPGPRAGNSAGR